MTVKQLKLFGPALWVDEIRPVGVEHQSLTPPIATRKIFTSQPR
jgi:hypothetical protein